MPTAKRNGYVFVGWYVADDEEKAEKLAGENNFTELYKLLNTPITINLDRKAGQPVRLSLHLVPKLQ